jgi:Integrase zinc binding domain
MASLFAQPYISPPDYHTVEFPSKKEILLVQHSAVDEYERYQQGSAMARQEVPPQKVDAGGMRMMNNALWIPEYAVDLHLRLCVEAHCRSAGHRACEATLGAIKEYVAWTTMAKDVKVFEQNCLHCVATIPGDKVPRPLDMQLHATCSAARTNVVLRIVMSTITVVWLVSSLPLYFYTMTSHRDIYIYNC